MTPKGASGLIYESNSLPERNFSQARLALPMSPNDDSGLISKAKYFKYPAFMSGSDENNEICMAAALPEPASSSCSQLERHPPLVLDFVLLAFGVCFRASPVTPPHEPATTRRTAPVSAIPSPSPRPMPMSAGSAAARRSARALSPLASSTSSMRSHFLRRRCSSTSRTRSPCRRLRWCESSATDLLLCQA